ncbi:MAG: MFS transporter, partial [Acidocella sp.]|nr:MFS transporter [Acidocella sp.]
PWELVASWGVLSGLGSGCVAMTLGATMINRWFVTRRGLIMGLLSASIASGTLIFLPLSSQVVLLWSQPLLR